MVENGTVLEEFKHEPPAVMSSGCVTNVHGDDEDIGPTDIGPRDRTEDRV